MWETSIVSAARSIWPAESSRTWSGVGRPRICSFAHTAIPYNRASRIEVPDFVKTTQRDHLGRRRRHSPASDHGVAEQAAAAGVRQADDLLSARDPDAGGHSRIPDHHHAAGPDRVSRPAGQRRAVGDHVRVRGAGAAQRHRAGADHRRAVPRRRALGADSRATIFSTARISPSCCSRRRAATSRRHGVRLLRAGSRALRGGRSSMPRAG